MGKPEADDYNREGGNMSAAVQSVQSIDTIPAETFRELNVDLADLRQIILLLLNKDAVQKIVKTLEKQHLDTIEQKKNENQNLYEIYKTFCNERMEDDLLPLEYVSEYLNHQLTLQSSLSALRGLVTNFVATFTWSPEAEHKRKVCLTKIDFLLENCKTRIDLLQASAKEVDWSGLAPRFFDRSVGFVW